MAFNFLQSLADRGQNTNDEGTRIDEFDYDSDESDVNLDCSDLLGAGGDINSSNELDLNPSRDDGLDLGECDPFS